MAFNIIRDSQLIKLEANTVYEFAEHEAKAFVKFLTPVTKKSETVEPQPVATVLTDNAEAILARTVEVESAPVIKGEKIHVVEEPKAE